MTMMGFLGGVFTGFYTGKTQPAADPSTLPPTSLDPASVGTAGVSTPTFGMGQTAYGQYIPIFAGHSRVPCVPLWLKDELSYVAADKPAPLISFAAIAGYPLVPDQARTLLEVHANGNKIVDTGAGLNLHGVTYRWYPGSTTQAKDPAIVAEKGDALTPAFRLRSYIVFEDFPTEAYGGQMPAITLTMTDNGGGARLALTDALQQYAAFKQHPGALVCEGLDGIEVDGLVIYDQDLPLKDFLAVHADPFGFRYFERGPDIVCARRVVGATYTVTKTIAEADLIPLDDDGALQTQHPGEVDLPDTCTLGYYALEIDFQRSHAYARTRVVNNPKDLPIDICFTITPSEAQTYAWNALFRAHTEGTRRKIALPPKHANIEPADILSITYRGTSYRVEAMVATVQQDSTVDVECCNVLTDQSATFTGYAGASVPLTATAPTNRVAPTISGTAQVGHVLTSWGGSWYGYPAPSFAYQWIWADTSAPIAGATATTYTPVSGDVGHTLALTVAATTSAGSVSATSAATAAVIS